MYSIDVNANTSKKELFKIQFFFNLIKNLKLLITRRSCGFTCAVLLCVLKTKREFVYLFAELWIIYFSSGYKKSLNERCVNIEIRQDVYLNGTHIFWNIVNYQLIIFGYSNVLQIFIYQSWHDFAFILISNTCCKKRNYITNLYKIILKFIMKPLNSSSLSIPDVCIFLDVSIIYFSFLICSELRIC